MRTTRSCPCAAPKPSRLTSCPRASRRTACTPKARARSSLSPTTRPPKAVRRTVAWKSKWSARAARVKQHFRAHSKAAFGRPLYLGQSQSMTEETLNADPAELAKFSELAHRWWDPESEFRPLHQINPLRLDWIQSYGSLAGKRVLDVGCGGGILSDSMARKGAQ